jgi:glycosyltransferase involved in cell wall biosynthesis
MFVAQSSDNSLLHFATWGPWAIPCGIAEYTKHMQEAFQRKGYSTFQYSHYMQPEDVIAQIKADKIDVLNIQYDHGLFPDELPAIINTIKSFGTKVIVTVHAESLYVKTLYEVADTFIYHKMPTLFAANDPKISVIPMGVPLFTAPDSRSNLRKKYGYSDDDLILVTTGFLLPTKAIPTIIHVVGPYLQKDPRIKVQLITPFATRFLETSQRLHYALQKIIARWNLGKRIRVITDFVPQQELSERIWISDLGYQWFETDTASTSAAVHQYITARVPVVTSPSTHFHDMNTGVIKTPFNRYQFTQVVINTLYNEKKRTELKNELENEYRSLNMNVAIERYLDIYNTILRVEK